MSAVAYELGSLKALKTAESNFSDGWRSKHAARRYEGKEGKREAKAGASGWSELQAKEDGAVKVVNHTVQTKMALAEKKWQGETWNAGTKSGNNNICVESDGDRDGEIASWRKKLKQRRQGAEIKVKKDGKTKAVKDDWESMVGLELSGESELRKRIIRSIMHSASISVRNIDAANYIAVSNVVTYFSFVTRITRRRSRARQQAEEGEEEG